MRFELTGRHVQITPVLRQLVGDKLTKLERLLNHGAVSAQAVLTRERRLRRIDVTLHARGEKFLHGCAATPTWETALNETFEKLAQQAQKVKGKREERRRRGAKGVEAAEGQPEAIAVKPARRPGRAAARPRVPRILSASQQAVTFMSVAEAARQVDGEGVFIFRDAETESLSVLYRRANGELTLVETDA